MKDEKHASRFARTAAVLLSVCLTASAQSASDARLQQACEALQKSPLSAPELQSLMDVSRLETNSPAVRSHAMAACSLAFLLQGNTNAFERALHALRAAYPDAETEALVTVGRNDAYVPCPDCAGAGMQLTLCPACMGSGACKACNGTGRKDGAACPSCKGRRSCAMCDGKKRINTSCGTCRGTSRVFKPTERLRENYSALLARLIALCQENARFAERFRQASQTADLPKRIDLLKGLIKEFPKRSDLAAAQKLLEHDIAAQTAEETLLRDKEAHDQAARDLETLTELCKTADPQTAINKLAAYRQEHPSSPNAIDVQSLLDERIAERNRRDLLRKIAYGSVALLGTLVALVALRPLLFRRRPEHIGPLPGMEHIHKSDFTDPLSLTAQDSKARSKPEAASGQNTGKKP